MHKSIHHAKGLSLIEITITLAISAIVMISITGVIGQALETERIVRVRNDVHRQARFAMQQMVQAISHTQRLMLPLAENPTTAWSESVRDPGVLAVTLDPILDRNKDGFADVDNDKDGRVDEDLSRDNTKNGAPGIDGIDDDGDGQIDEGGNNDDNDEDGQTSEDHLDGLDNDGDGAIDEDFPDDINNDSAPGVVGIDDDGDSLIDEGHDDDDDEDGTRDEDWYDPVVFFLSGTTLMQRIPNINPTDGTDYTEYPIAENVTQFRVERIPQGTGRAILVDLSLTVTDSNGESAQINTQVRVGSRL